MIDYKVVKKTDNTRILELYRLAGWWEMDDNPAYLDTVAGIIASTFCFVIAEEDGAILGMGRAISDGFSDAYIQDVTVDPVHRGKGIGKGIIRTLVSFLQEHKIQWIGLISEPGYERFYQSLGFSVMPSYTPFLLDQNQKREEE
ncbi:MAG: GNAT family N-acetyltransferase [Candidatus Cloacimonadota bacterium]